MAGRQSNLGTDLPSETGQVAREGVTTQCSLGNSLSQNGYGCIWYRVPGNKYLVPNTWFQILGTKYLVARLGSKPSVGRSLLVRRANFPANVTPHSDNV